MDVKPDKQAVLPAITLVDGTGQLQTVHPDTNPRYHKLIATFGQATGVPVVLNTSFNLKGEPIVNTPAEAFATFQKSGMDVLVLGDCVVDKLALRSQRMHLVEGLVNRLGIAGELLGFFWQHTPKGAS